MRPAFLALALMTTTGWLISPRATAQDNPSPVTVPLAQQFDVHSKSGLDYRIFVAAPPGPPPTEGSPVVYLSDGNSNFPIVLAAARRVSREAPPVVVVGIGYPSDDPAVHQDRRSFDLTPALAPGATLTRPGPGAPGQPPPRSGGNDAFLAFIEEELKPIIEQKYKIDRTKQTLFGHSFGGLFVLHTLFSKPEAFQNYIASSPSIWWNDGSIRTEADAFVEKLRERPVTARVLISVGEWEQKPPANVSKERADFVEKRRAAGNAQDVAAKLTEANGSGLTVEFRQYPEEEHGTVVLPAASRGMRFALTGK